MAADQRFFLMFTVVRRKLPQTHEHFLQLLQNVWFMRWAKIMQQLPASVIATSQAWDGSKSPKYAPEKINSSPRSAAASTLFLLCP
jgi:hypothetical protein